MKEDIVMLLEVVPLMHWNSPKISKSQIYFLTRGSEMLSMLWH